MTSYWRRYHGYYFDQLSESAKESLSNLTHTEGSWIKLLMDGDLDHDERVPGIYVVIAHEGPKDIGVMTVLPTLMRRADLWLPRLHYEVSVVVSLEYQGQGVATRLANHVKDFIEGPFMSFPWDDKGRRFYEKMGFEVFDKEKWVELTPLWPDNEWTRET